MTVNNLLKDLHLCKVHEMETKLPKKKVLARLKDVCDPTDNDYQGRVTDDGFYLERKNNRPSEPYTIRRGFKIAASGSVTEADGITKISFVIRFDASYYFAYLVIAALLLLAGIARLFSGGAEGVISLVAGLVAVIISLPVMQLITHLSLGALEGRLLDILEPLLVYDDEQSGSSYGTILGTES